MVGTCHLVEREDSVHQRPYLTTLEKRTHLLKPPPLSREEDSVQGDVLRVQHAEVALGGKYAGYSTARTYGRQTARHQIGPFDIDDGIHALAGEPAEAAMEFFGMRM